MSLLWKLQAQFAGYALARDEIPELELVPRRLDASPTDSVLSGEVEFAVAAPAHVLQRGRRAEELVLVALFMSRSPIRLVGLRRGVGARLEAIQRARVGVWEGEDLEVRAMLLANNVSLDAVAFVPMGDDVRPLLRGDVDLLQATTYEELPRLVREGAATDDLVVHDPASWGVDVAKDGLFVRADVLARDRELVTSVVGASARGWRRAVEERPRAIEAVLALQPDLDEALQREQLDRIADLVDPARPLGRPDVAEVERARRVLRLVGADPGTKVPVDPAPWEAAMRA
jgi:NitT/TauT family transport system substrate-binding protein